MLTNIQPAKSLALSTCLALLPCSGLGALSVEPIFYGATDEVGEWMSGPLNSSPRIAWLAMNTGYIIFDPDLEGVPLEDTEYYVLIETTPDNMENVYPLEGSAIRQTFDFRFEDGIYIYRLKICDIAGCRFVGRPLLVVYFTLAPNTAELRDLGSKLSGTV